MVCFQQYQTMSGFYPFRRSNHSDAIFIQRCLKNSGVEVYNAAY